MIYGGILILLLLSCFAARNYKKEIFLNCDKKEHPICFMYPFVMFIFEKTKLDCYLWKRKDTKEVLMALYLHREEKQLISLYWCKKCSVTLLVFMLGVFMAFTADIKEMGNRQLKSGYLLKRNSYGEGEKKVTLQAEVRDGEERYKEEVEVVVEEQKYHEEKRIAKFEEAKKYIDEHVLGKNDSFENIRYSLNFVESLPNSGIKIRWFSEDDRLIDSKGSVNQEGIPLEGKITKITALIQYYEVTEEYPIFLKVKPTVLTREEQIHKELAKAVKIREDDDLTEEDMRLPLKLDKKEVEYSEKRKGDSEKIFLYAVLAAGVVCLLTDRELMSLYKKRERELLLDYPEIMNKFVLLLGAGMTTKGAWEKIALEYKKKKQKRNEKARYAYEEMLVTYYELCNGVTEMKAYESFGRRIKVLPYLKFSSLIAQNLKKGSKGLLELLEYEAIDAFNERKELAKRMGEEASTKLLVPMMLMLLLVMGVIIFPAFMTL